MDSFGVGANGGGMKIRNWALAAALSAIGLGAQAGVLDGVIQPAPEKVVDEPPAATKTFAPRQGDAGSSRGSGEKEIFLDKKPIQAESTGKTVEEFAEEEAKADPWRSASPEAGDGRPKGCGTLPNGAPVAVADAAAKGGGSCSAQKAAAPIMAALEAANHELWCSDPAGAKSGDRKADEERLEAHKRASIEKAVRAAALRADELERKSEAAGGAEVLRNFPKNPASRGAATLSAGGAPLELKSTPGWKPSKKAAGWDEREAKMCSHWETVGAQMGLSLEVVGAGSFDSGSGRCQGFLAVATVLTGRFFGSKAPILLGTGGCSGSTVPEVGGAELAEALADESAAQAWMEKVAEAGWKGSGSPAALGKNRSRKSRLRDE